VKNGITAVPRPVRLWLDPTDRTIIGELMRDRRLGVAELGRRVKLPPPSVAEGMRRLEHQPPA
jgi:Lrp/AsnC family leucine-responsive transcriptional regulator